jgi:hypothetical protein
MQRLERFDLPKMLNAPKQDAFDQLICRQAFPHGHDCLRKRPLR